MPSPWVSAALNRRALEKQLYQSRIRFCGGKRIGAVDHHSDLPPGAAQPCREGQELGFLVVGALRWGIRIIEQRGQPRPAGESVRPIPPYVVSRVPGGDARSPGG